MEKQENLLRCVVKILKCMFVFPTGKMLTRSQRRRLDEDGGMMIVYSSYDDEAAPEVKVKRKKRAKTTVSDLKRELGMFGLSTEGKKQDLQDRLATHLQQPRNGIRILTYHFQVNNLMALGVLKSKCLTHLKPKGNLKMPKNDQILSILVLSTVCLTSSF